MDIDNAKFVMACVALGIAAIVKVVKGLSDGVTGNAKMRAAIKRLKEEGEAAEKERLALAEKAEEAKGAEAVETDVEGTEEENNLAAEAVEETAIATEENQEETAEITKATGKPEEEEDSDEASMNGRTWKCPQCGRINPTYQYACNCGNRFR